MSATFILLQKLLPQHSLSRMVGKLAASKTPWIKQLFITRFIKTYNVNMEEAQYSDPADYSCFNEFFTRPLKAGARPLAADPDAVVCPADGVVCAIGNITQNSLIQAKGKTYSVTTLLGGDEQRAAPFEGGTFATVYLSPKDYHRVHSPLAGTLREMIYVPGKLFSVNQITASNIDNLFAINERAVCIFDTVHGPMAVVLVGAMIVASVETVWAGLVTPPKRELKAFAYDEAARQPIHLEKGAELGRFKLGSTAIVLFGPEQVAWAEQLAAGSPVRMGQLLGNASQA